MNVIDSLKEDYGIEINHNELITDKTYKIICENKNCYFVKKTKEELEDKYNFLLNQGVNNILYPLFNNKQKFITRSNQNAYYVNDYIDNYQLVKDSNAYNMVNALDKLHLSTVIKKQLSISKARPKFEELTEQLDYKFKLIENFIRKLETRSLNESSYVFLENYHIILNAKQHMIRLQKNIILSIKSNQSVEYVFLHNNPKIDHFIMSRGSGYLTSIDNSKIGIDGLDYAKFYIENHDLDLDFKKVLFDDNYSHKEDFYYNYFCFMVLFIYIKRINISNMNMINLEDFVQNCKSIDKFIHDFLNKNQEI
ncbi:MAG: hypothetical protein IJ501_01180 [Bacilli bacterium]|nr:hypothetical protein [Bacilli bacterium]MBQ8472095.1 hypothetical protein [Bacilli bacterium]